MEIEIIKIQSQSDPLDSTREFGIFLKKIQGSVHMLHWYATDYNVHEILGELYESLDGLFDKLQEEIIGTSMIQNVNFPTFSTGLEIDNIEQFKGEAQDIILSYNKISKITQEILTSLEFNSYISSVKSGINNTKEDIITNFNKTSYLLTMVNC
jgi:DNA-binding ferritin-like protein